MLEQQTGPVILVGHSWGGVVVTEAGNDSKVKALVYVAAFSPDNGQSINDILKDKPAPSWAASLRKDSSGGMTLSEQAILDDFAQDLPRNEAQLIFSTQGPWSGNCLGDKVSNAAWHDKKSWTVVATKDRMIDPNLQIAMASQIHAHTIHVAASHALLLSQPKQVADAIIEAVKSVN